VAPRSPVVVPKHRRAGPAAALALLASLSLAAPAAAGTRVTEPWPQPPADSLAALHLPSPAVAQDRSVAATLLPLAFGTGFVVADVAMQGDGYLALTGVLIGSAGIVFGPAAGFAYGRLPGRATAGILVRLALVVGMPVAAVMANEDQGSEEAAWMGAVGFVGGNAVALVYGVVDMATVRGAVEKANRERTAAARVSFGPAVAPFSHAPGVAVSLPLGPGGR
jgi:hypothetical protein